MKKVYIISEIGINHNGDLDLAKKTQRMVVLKGGKVFEEVKNG